MADLPILSVPELSGISGLQWITAEQTGTETTITTILHGKADRGALFNNEVLDALSDSRVGEYGWYGGHNLRYGYGRQYDEIDVTAVELTVNYNKGGYYSRFEAVARTESRPLEEKLDLIGTTDELYRVWWNHEVRAAKGSAALTTGQEDTIKAYTTLSQGVGIEGYYWAKSNQSRKSTEDVFLDARFPGVQGYGVPMEQVKEIVFARSEEVVNNIISAVGQLRVPSDSDGNNYDNSRTDYTKWLITSANKRRRLGWFEADLTYAYAKGGWLNKDSAEGKSGVYNRYINA